VRFIDRQAVLDSLDPRALVESIDAAFQRQARGELPPPERLDSYLPDGEFHVKAGHAPGHFVVKANSAFFANPPQRPAIQGVIVVFETTHGTPVAVVDSGSVTALRTAAASAVAARALSGSGNGVLALLGAGTQGWVHAQALRSVVDVQEVLVWSRDPQRAHELALRIETELGVGARACATPAEAVLPARTVVTCTPSTHPLLDVGDVAPGTFIAAVGADSPHKQELTAALTAAAVLVTDVTTQCATAGELHHALDAGLVGLDHVSGELGEVLIGSRPGRRSDEDIVIFDSTGTGFQDAAAAVAVLASG
jgi:alanine dehydrogenase